MNQQENSVEGENARTDGENPSSWWNRIRYGLYAPIYDWVAKPFESGRKRAIKRVNPQPDDRVLILGCGTGMDLDYLPTGISVTAIDVSEGMIERTERRADSLEMDVDARVGDAQSLPFEIGIRRGGGYDLRQGRESHSPKGLGSPDAYQLLQNARCDGVRPVTG